MEYFFLSLLRQVQTIPSNLLVRLVMAPLFFMPSLAPPLDWPGLGRNSAAKRLKGGRVVGLNAAFVVVDFFCGRQSWPFPVQPDLQEHSASWVPAFTASQANLGLQLLQGSEQGL
jgi:hypothetical protein